MIFKFEVNFVKYEKIFDEVNTDTGGSVPTVISIDVSL